MEAEPGSNQAGPLIGKDASKGIVYYFDGVATLHRIDRSTGENKCSQLEPLFQS
jgi:hypothetical protein